MFILDLKLRLGEEPLSLGDPQPFPRYVEIDRITGMGGGALSLDDRPASPGRSELDRHIKRDARDR
jgi:hypothetical protein